VADITQAQLVTRADGGNFTFTVVAATSQVAGADPLQQQFPTGTQYQQRTSISWTFRYRTRLVKSLGLVVPSGLSALAQQLSLNEAWSAMDSIDARMGTLGVPWNGLTGQPNQPQWNPAGPNTNSS
jgi:hypothetical protein